MNRWFPRVTLLIERVLTSPTNFPFVFETCSNWILSISISKIYLRSCSNLLIGTNPRSLPLRNESILSSRAPSCTIYITTQQKGGWVVVEQNNGCRAKSTFIPNKMAESYIHSWSCPSSRTLLSTTSFQTKFYHNIPLVWNQYVIDSIMESWIVIGSVGK